MDKITGWELALDQRSDDIKSFITASVVYWLIAQLYQVMPFYSR